MARAIGRTGGTITTAGVILGGTFAVLAVAGGSAGGGQIQQIGYGVAAGILMDTFLLRSLLVPSLVVLLGDRNWWPSHLSRTPLEGDARHGSGATAADGLRPRADVGAHVPGRGSGSDVHPGNIRRGAGTTGTSIRAR